VVQTIDTTLCQGQTLTVNGVTYTSAGAYNDTAFYTASGCDSIQFVINVDIDSFVVQTIDTTICQGQTLTVNGVTYTSAGAYNDTAFYTASGCDSIQFVINLGIDSFVVQTIDTTLCQGQTLTVNGVTYTASGAYNDTSFYTASGCDSIQFVINLDIDSFTITTIDTTICQGQTLTVNGVTYAASGAYNDTAFYTASGCDSIQFVINVDIDSFVVQTIDTTICQGQTLTVNGVTYTSAGAYNDTAFYTASGCDSIQFVINLGIDSFVVQTIDTTLCQGQTLTVNGVTYTASGAYNDTAFYTASGCDSIQFVINVDIDSFVVQTIDTTICQGQTLTVNGVTYAASGAYNDTAFYTASGCDSIQFVINLEIDSFTITTIDTTICQGQTLTVNGVTYTASGAYNDTAFYTASRCDSIQFVINVDIDSFVVQTIDTTICQGQTLTVNGVTYAASGAYNDTAFYTASGCDSIQFVINLEIDSFTITTIDTTICQGQTLTVNGVTYTASGAYNDTAFYTASGCDSIQFVINVEIDSFVVQTIDTTICQGQTLTVNGVTYAASGAYNDTAFYTASGCDSIQFVINVDIDSFVVQTIDTTICQGQTLTVNGVTYAASGAYNDTAFYTASGCDSIQFVINLAIDSFVVQTIDTTICQGQTLTVNGVTYAASGAYNDTAFYTASGCDSIQFVINVDIDSFVVQTIDTTICQGQTLTVNGVTYTSAGAYNDTAFYTASGCDSIQFVINVAIDSFVVQTIDTTICQGQTLTVNGVTYTTAGAYNDTAFYTASGCDSIQFVINVEIDSFVIQTIDTTICQGQTLTVNGVTYAASGAYNDTAFYTASGCDSIQFVINVDIDSFVVQTIDTTICQGQTLTVNGVTYTSAGAYNDTAFYTASGCDSIQFVINVAIDSFVVQTIDTTICQGQTLTVNGVTYAASGAYNDTAFYTASGCDSIQFVINVEIDSFTITTIDTTICQGQTLTVNGVTYTASGAYNDTAFYAASGCDSIQFVINVDIDSFVVQTIDTTICQGQTLTVNGVTYTSAGAYNDTAFYTASGCDSIQFVINVEIDSFVVQTIDTTICQGQTLTVNGVTYTALGAYNDTAFYTASGCDSIQFVINLAIDSFVVQTIDTTICQGQTLTVNGVTYAASGAYNDTAFYTASGCDSIQFVINLDIDSFTITTIDTTICQGQTLTVNGVTYAVSGAYNDTAFYTASGCDSIQFVINVDIDSFEVQTIDTTICQGQTLTVNGVTYAASGAYNDTAFYTASGCDSIQFVINVDIDSFVVQTIDTTICQGQTLTVNGVTYTSAGAYNDTAFYTASGCDSIQFVINIDIDSFVVQIIDTTICQGQTLTVNGVTYAASGAYNDTAFYTASGCDSIQFVINVDIDSFVVQTIDTTICQGQSLTVNGVTYTSAGAYTDTASYTASGCDSIQFVINVDIDSFVVQTIDTTLCQGQTLTVNGVTYTSAGAYNDTAFYTASGCDSIQFVINVDIDSFVVQTIDTTICQGQTITVNGVTYSTTGIFNDTLSYASSGCDSIQFVIDLEIQALPNVIATCSEADSATCINQTLTLFGSGTPGVTYTWNNGVNNNIAFNPPLGSSSYIVIGEDVLGCLNSDTISIIGHPTFNTTVNASICEDENYTLPNGNIVNTEGSYSVTLASLQACDSIVTTNLTVNRLGSFTELTDLAVCDGFSTNLIIENNNMLSFEWFVNDGTGNVSLVGNPNYLGANTSNVSFNLDTNLHLNTYTVIMLDACGNSYSSDMILSVYQSQAVSNPLNDTTFCNHEISAITVDYNGNNYVWNTGQVGPSIIPDFSGEYIVEFVENVTNCLLSDTIQINLEDCIGNCVVLAPTGFSPNASGNNDIFRVVTTCDEGFSYFYFAVFNRWGELIYATDDWRSGWDGTYKGREAEIGTYTYFVEYTKELTTKKEMLKGNVTLIK
jgi:gliding motility-associated-like protein